MHRVAQRAASLRTAQIHVNATHDKKALSEKIFSDVEMKALSKCFFAR
jgi:hypothetical protein